MFKCFRQGYSTCNPTCIISARRTPIGRFMGSLSHFTGPELGALAVLGAVSSINLDPKLINEVIMGCSLPSSLGQNPSKRVSFRAGLPKYIPCTTIHHSSSSSLQSLLLSSRSIELGQNDIVVAGGFQSMSNVPFYVSDHRKGVGYGDQSLQDGIITDSLMDPLDNIVLGLYAEKTAMQMDISRQIQDDYSVVMYQRAIKASTSGAFGDQILYLSQERNEEVFDDEELNGFNKESFTKLQPIYSKNGTVTVGNSAQFGDGGCALILASEQAVKKHKLPVLAKIIGYSQTAVDPSNFCVGNSQACQAVMRATNTRMDDVDVFQFGQMFSVSTIATLKALGIPIQKANIHGGSVALGDPIGMGGARLVTSLMNALSSKKKRLGVVSSTNGLGESTAFVIQNVRL